MFLYEQIETFKLADAYKDMPPYISENINAEFEIRPYQQASFQNFITYFESSKLKRMPSNVLFHMATGSGKTLIMAGLMLYLYKNGYRDFLFFVNLSNIVKKTKDNFLNNNSSKYLFADEIKINNEAVKIKEVDNFQYSDPDAINICFSTTQGLHTDMWMVKENAMSFDDFQGRKVVLISDEAHHLNASTKKMNKIEEDNYRSWENTVKNIFEMNNQNVLLEFTATCDLSNSFIRSQYESKIVYNYPLSEFRKDKYSKEIKTLRTDIDMMDRALLSILFSQYRLKVFQDHRLSIKPVVMFKSKNITPSKEFMGEFIKVISNLTADKIYELSMLTQSETLLGIFKYFSAKGITFEQLAQELKDEFSEEHCINANELKDEDEGWIAINTLERSDNPYRAVFAVDKLNEGWDVLNLFDIVRLYETRDGKDGKPGKVTLAEAQLIGRGARYCPFQINREQSKFQRKFDDDLDNSLRICEELYYHCFNESRYIGELNNALKEIGLDPDSKRECIYRVKDEFKEDDLYKSGYVFVNDIKVINRSEVTELLPSTREKIYKIRLATGKTGEDTIMDDDFGSDTKVTLYPNTITVAEVADYNYAILIKALQKYDIYKFSTLKCYFPNLKSTREFITSDLYLGKIKIEIISTHEKLLPKHLYIACVKILGEISDAISSIKETYEGTKEFRTEYLRDIVTDKRILVEPIDGGKGKSQNDLTVKQDDRLDLVNEAWFVFNDNYGTSEEKSFVAYFKNYVDNLKRKYDKVYLIRNERHMHLYSFRGGERFEPDYILFLLRNKADGYEQLQIFIEPKGDRFIGDDKWKEDFMMELEANAIPVVKFKDDNEYCIWGFHFYNRNERMTEFDTDMKRILDTSYNYEIELPLVAETSIMGKNEFSGETKLLKS